MVRLPASLAAWAGDAFASTLQREIAELPAGTLPLAQGSTTGGYVSEEDLAVTVLDASADPHAITARLGVFFAEVIAGCSCGDDPGEQTGYCELTLRIDRTTAEASFSPS